jgi:spore coat polysaccharide biosynthesis predicted glycosyltransferase SpsG
MASMIFESDLAVTGCGSTTYELLALGTPFVGSVQADNQRPIAEALQEDELATVLDTNPSVDDFGCAIRELVGDVDRRRAYRKRGRDRVDGHGAVRVANKLEQLAE